MLCASAEEPAAVAVGAGVEAIVGADVVVGSAKFWQG